MKNFIKKIIVGILSFALLITAQNVFASSVTWNQASNDCKSISIVNATTNQGYASPCWTGTSVSADMGEVINVRIYYHNTGTDTATNTHVMLIPNSSLSSSSTTKSFYGRITSDQGSVSFSQTVTANLSSSQSLSFLSAKWYTNNTSETLTSPLDGQSGNEVLTDNGLAIGSITSGWSSQGSVVIAFRVSSNVAPQLCKDTSATNYNGTLPCQYPTPVCKDTSATNYLGALPCQYPAQVCRDTSATNYGGSLPCVYPQLCKDTSATNYNGTLPCQYPAQLCRDTSATNYNGALPCQYPAQVCRDTSATNYGRALPCVYPQLCKDTSATNYNRALPCQYPAQVCRDTPATNYGRALPCQYPAQVCRDTSATNYGRALPCQYPAQVCRDTSATNYGRALPCVYPLPQFYNSNVVTTVATNISQTGAQLNGIVTNSIYGNTNVYFQYGTTVNMGIRTATRTVNGNSNFNDFVSNLSSNTIYYFQAFAEDTNGVSQGAIQVFKTLGYSTGVITTPVKQVIIQGPTVSSSTSPIVLRIENKYQSFGIGDIVDYTVYYKNISSSKLTNPLVQVIIPEGITLTNTSRGTYSENDRTLSVPIEDLNPSDEGVIYLQARVDLLDTNLAQIVTTAILVYTNPNGAQENAMAYVLNNPKVINLLGASAFFGNIFGLGLIGWLLLAILILLLVLIARSLYKRRNVVTTTTQKTISQ